MPARTTIEQKTITTVVGTYGSATIRITVMNNRAVIKGSFSFSKGKLSDLKRAFGEALAELDK
jgi:hypothetical protein